MPSEGWLDSTLPKADKKDWISPVNDPPQTDLDTLRKERQEKALAPEPEIVTPPPPPVEDIPYKSIAVAINSAATSLLDASVGIKKSENKLLSATLGVDEHGDKGREIFEKVEMFKSKITLLYSEIESLSKEMGIYKLSLPHSEKSE